MAKKAKAEKGAFREALDEQVEKEKGGHGVSAIRGNGFDPEKVKSYVSRIQNLHGDLKSRQSEYMTDCKVIRGDIKEVLDEAKDEGIPKKELRRLIKRLELEEKIEDIRNELEGDEVDNYDLLCDALGKFGDSPLGQAALAKASKNGAAATA